MAGFMAKPVKDPNELPRITTVMPIINAPAGPWGIVLLSESVTAKITIVRTASITMACTWLICGAAEV